MKSLQIALVGSRVVMHDCADHGSHTKLEVDLNIEFPDGRIRAITVGTVMDDLTATAIRAVVDDSTPIGVTIN